MKWVGPNILVLSVFMSKPAWYDLFYCLNRDGTINFVLLSDQVLRTYFKFVYTSVEIERF